MNQKPIDAEKVHSKKVDLLPPLIHAIKKHGPDLVEAMDEFEEEFNFKTSHLPALAALAYHVERFLMNEVNPPSYKEEAQRLGI